LFSLKPLRHRGMLLVAITCFLVSCSMSFAVLIGDPTHFSGTYFVETTGKIGIPVLLSAELLDDVNSPIQGETVYFEIYHGDSWNLVVDDGNDGTSFVTDEHGLASVYYTFPVGVAPGDYDMRVVYSGANGYEDCLLEATFNGHKPQWLVLIYLCADNNLEDASMTDFYEELWSGRDNDEVSIVVLYDRASGYRTDNPFGGDNWETTRFYRFSKDYAFYTDLGELNLGDPLVLSDFVALARTYCEADHTALILWDHGSGWKSVDTTQPLVTVKTTESVVDIPLPIDIPLGLFSFVSKAALLPVESVDEVKGVCWDDTNMGNLTQAEVRSTLALITDSGATKLDLFAYDACLMGMVELAFGAAPYVTTFVASEDNESLDGFSFDGFLGGATLDASTTPDELGSAIVSSCVLATLGCWNLTSMDTRANELSLLADRMIAVLDAERDNITAARDAAMRFNSPSCYSDLKHFCVELISRCSDTALKGLAQDVIDGLDDPTFFVEWKTLYDGSIPLGGLSVYLPSSSADPGYGSYFLPGYLAFCDDPNQSWDDFLVALFDYRETDDNFEPNDTFAEPYDISSSSGVWLSSWGGFGIQGDEDWFSIVVGASEDRVFVDLTFTHADGDIDIELWDPTGAVLAKSASVDDDEHIDKTVVPGTYYLRLYYGNQGNAYDLLWYAVGANDAPTIDSGPTALPSPVTGTQTTLDVTASDADGPLALTYTWSVDSGPTTVDFSPNGSADADSTQASFSAAGTYTLLVTVSDGVATDEASVVVEVDSTLTAIEVSPADETVAPDTGTCQFTATAIDQFASTMSGCTFVWSVDGGGAIDSTGLFTAGSEIGGPHTVEAECDGEIGTASVTVDSPPPPPAGGGGGGCSLSTGSASPSGMLPLLLVPLLLISRRLRLGSNIL